MDLRRTAIFVHSIRLRSLMRSRTAPAAESFFVEEKDVRTSRFSPENPARTPSPQDPTLEVSPACPSAGPSVGPNHLLVCDSIPAPGPVRLALSGNLLSRIRHPEGPAERLPDCSRLLRKSRHAPNNIFVPSGTIAGCAGRIPDIRTFYPWAIPWRIGSGGGGFPRL
jgi:hypothetical protein